MASFSPIGVLPLNMPLVSGRKSRVLSIYQVLLFSIISNESVIVANTAYPFYPHYSSLSPPTVFSSSSNLNIAFPSYYNHFYNQYGYGPHPTSGIPSPYI